MDNDIRTSMGSAFGHDFSHVRVHTDAGAAADRIGARAVTVGSSILFGSGEYAPHTRQGRALLAHELAHVVQTNRPGSGSGASVEADADRAAEAAVDGRDARPLLAASPGPHCKLRQSGRVPDGQYTIDLADEGRRTGVRVEFLPDKSGPVTDRITFLQIVQTLTDGKVLPWAPLHPGEEIVDRIRTREGPGVERGFSLDIAPGRTRPRKPGEPNVSGDYPHFEQRQRTTKTTGPGGETFTSVTPVEAIGRNPRDGTPESAVMVDKPGGGPTISTFRFETSAHAEEIGHTYGAVHWGFDYDPVAAGKPHVTKEFARFTPRVSDTLRAAVVAFNKDVGNRHVVQEGETLRALSVRYYRTSGRAYAMFMVNPRVLPRFDPDAPLPAGRQLELPTPWDAARYGTGGVQPDRAEQDTGWDRLRRSQG